MRRRIIIYGHYFADFMASLTDKEAEKVKYILSLLEREDRMPVKFIKLIRDELRIAYNGNIYRVFFIFDDGCVVVLFHGFRKKTAKTPRAEIEKAMQIKSAYYEYKKRQSDGFQRGT